MARHTSANYTNFAFTWGDANTDAFVHGDVQLLAQAVEAHDHSSGKGLAALRIAAGATMSNTLVNTGTLTFPTSTDTLVGRATTDALTNKTITGTTNVIGSGSLSLTHTTGASAYPAVTTTNPTFTVIESLTITPPASGYVLVFATFVFTVSSQSGNHIICDIYNNTDTAIVVTNQLFADTNQKWSCTLVGLAGPLTAAAKTFQARATWDARTNDSAQAFNAGDANVIWAVALTQ